MTALVIAAATAMALALSVLRLFAGPTLYDRVLAVSTTCTQGALVTAALSIAVGRNAWLDLAFGFVAVGLVINVVTLKFFRARTFQPPLSGPSEAV